MAEFHRLKSRHDDDEEPAAWKDWNRAAEALTKQAATADMPRLDHLARKDYQQVYEPAEDTYLMMDALQYELEAGVFDANNHHTTPHDNDDFVLLEIGCGTGVSTVWFRQAWQKRYPGRPLKTFVTDINPRALQVCLRTDAHNQASPTTTLPPIQAVRCDLATDLLEMLTNAVDVLIFNPPYVPTPDDEVVEFTAPPNDDNDDDNTLLWDDSLIAAAWAGGTDGRRVVDRAVPQIQQLLRGRAYLVTVDDNQPAALAQRLQTQYGLDMKPLFRRRAHNEYLTIQKIVPMEVGR